MLVRDRVLVSESEKEYTVFSLISSGTGQGDIYKVACGDEIFALKLFYEGESDLMRDQMQVLMKRGKACPAYVHPLDTLSVDGRLGYIMEYIPDSIIPFSISKQKATNLFKLWIKKRKLAPNDLKKKANINSMHGIYLPCWLYDYDTHTQYSGIGVREYRDKDGDTHVVRKRISGEVNNSYNGFGFYWKRK